MQKSTQFSLDMHSVGGSGSLPAVPLDAPVPDVEVDEAAARSLEASGRFRILRRLERIPPLPPSDAPLSEGSRVAIIVDVETTGLGPTSCEVIELGMLAFRFDDDGLGECIGIFEGLRQPSARLSAEVSRLTGLTDADLAGQAIDDDAVTRFIAPASLVIAHNAGFDRPICERLCKAFAGKAWACSATEIDWRALGHDSAKLVHLLASVGYFNAGHRALADCEAVATVLKVARGTGGGSAMADLVRVSLETRWEIRAECAPYTAKDFLKGRGYRWDAAVLDGPRPGSGSWTTPDSRRR